MTDLTPQQRFIASLLCRIDEAAARLEIISTCADVECECCQKLAKASLKILTCDKPPRTVSPGIDFDEEAGPRLFGAGRILWDEIQAEALTGREPQRKDNTP